ncbi:MAG TPA: hypothetical protein VHO94_02590 [Oscillospiraceae bacterium]|nr:hypothetical protein [Oscillospiraceae bacterium]
MIVWKIIRLVTKLITVLQARQVLAAKIATLTVVLTTAPIATLAIVPTTAPIAALAIVLTTAPITVTIVPAIAQVIINK